jgi:uncharacterized spore protein YtfJ
MNDTMTDTITDTITDATADNMTAKSLEHALETATDSISVRRVFGNPISSNGITMIPAARIAGAGGGGGGADKVHGANGMGGGFGSASRPVGMYVVEGDNVSWKPATDRNLVALLTAVVALFALSTIRFAIKVRFAKRFKA